MKNRVMVIGDGEKTDFWRDAWCGSTPLRSIFPDMFDICNEQKIKVAEVARRGWRLTFRRWLDEHKQYQLRKLYDLLSPFSVCRGKDTPKWLNGKTGTFSVKSVYESLCSREPEKQMKFIWQAKIPLKIKIFMWLIYNNAILTKDNLVKRNWVGDERCSFCYEPKSISYLLFECTMSKYVWSLVAIVVGALCHSSSIDQFWSWIKLHLPGGGKYYMPGLAAICWSLWMARNGVCFENKIVRSPTEIICSTSSLLSYWAGLQEEGDRELLEKGAEILKNTALHFHPQDGRGDVDRMLLQQG